MPESAPSCASCATPLQGPYCHACGEKVVAPSDLGLGAFLHEIFHFNTHLDNKVVKTLGPLLREPGALTEAWAAGRRNAHAKPVQLFVVVNLLFFVLAKHLGMLRWDAGWFLRHGGIPGLSPEALEAKRVALGVGSETFIRLLNQGVDPHKKWIFLILIPLTALVLACLHPRRRIVEHTVFAIHYATFTFLFLLGLWGVIYVLAIVLGRHQVGDAFLAPVSMLALGGYLALALRRVYHLGWPRALAEGGLVALALLPAIFVAQRLAFHLAFRGL